jgi:hypothetical protein
VAFISKCSRTCLRILINVGKCLSVVTLKVPDDQITTLENCFLGAIKKLENVILIDSSKILDAVNACNSSIAKIIPQQGTNKSAEAICE